LNRRELKTFRRSLLAWFRQHRRDLPWRSSADPYRVWISEIMLQQTRVGTVIPYYNRFLKRFPDVHTLARASEPEVLRYWSGLGYYSRARNLRRAAEQITGQPGGAFPRTREGLLALAGIGPYTASAIASIAFAARHAVLDGNVARVLARLAALRGDLRQKKRWNQLQSQAEKLLARQAPGDWNQALMELGATVCLPRAPRCALCPVADFCRVRKTGRVDEIPEKTKKRAGIRVALTSLVLLDDRNRTLLLAPAAPGSSESSDHDISRLTAGLWHFPTVATGKSLRQDLGELLPPAAKETRAAFDTALPLSEVRHTVTYRRIVVAPYLLRVSKLPDFPRAQPVALGNLSSFAVSNLTRKIARIACQKRPLTRS
jgi:A/G-specific adenine glycosylase